MTAAPDVSPVEQQDAAALLGYQSEVLALLSSGAGLPRVLDTITCALEALMPASSCSLLLLDPGTGALRHGSAPSLPLAYLSAIDGLVPGPDEGSCGTAAFRAEPVVAVDVRTDPRWVRYLPAADAAGLRACWSTPVVGRSGGVVGTFAVYHPHVHEPDAREHYIVSQLTGLAAVAIEHATMVRDLTVSEERFRRAFDDTAVAMALLDASGVVTRANDALVALSGPVVGDRLASRIAEPDRAGFAAAIAELATGSARSVQSEVHIGDATFLATLSIVRGADGEPVQVSVSMLDVTERRAAQRERRARQEADVARRSAEAASRAKSQFLSAVSHEMRTPLQAITGFAELIGTLDLDPDRRREALRHITVGAGHLLALVDDTLDLARIEADALPLTAEPVVVSEVVAEVVEFLAPVAADHAVRLEPVACAGTVTADPRRLRQVLINLVSNGLRYSGPQGVVRVGARECGRYVHVEVCDNGPGIPAVLRDTLFEPFQQADPRAGNGVGLGLMLARGLSEAMGGRLVLADADEGGRGTLAAVVLPQVVTTSLPT